MNMADSKQLVNVEWKGYCAALLSGVWQIFKDQLLVDVCLTCHNQGLKVHKLMLAVFFPELKESILAADGKRTGSIRELCVDHLSKDRRGDVIKYLVEFAYSGKVSLPENRVGSVLEAAELVGFDGLAQSIRNQCGGKRMTGSSGKASTSGAPGEMVAVTDIAAGTQGSAGPKRSNRKGIPMKLIKTDPDVVFGRGSPVHDQSPPEEPVVRTRRMQMSSRNVRSVSSGSESGGGGGEGSDSMSGAGSPPNDEDEGGSSDEAVSSHGAEDVQDEEDGGDSQDGDCAEKDQHKNAEQTVASSCDPGAAENENGRRAEAPEDTPRWARGLQVLRCHRCDYMGTNQKRFDRHCAIHDRDEAKRKERFKCTVCPKEFRTSKGCQDHMVFHNPDMQQKCKYCSFVTNKKWSLMQHFAIRHRVDEDGNPVTMQFRCSECDFECVTGRQLSTHALEKHPKHQLQCELCSYKNSHMHRIREHMAVKHGVDDKGNSLEKSLKCAECDYMCHTRKQMKDHASRKHKDTPDNQYMCDECGYTTIYKSNLRFHIDHVHRGVRRFMCDVCGKRISKRSNFLRHKRSHLGLKPFNCTLCGQAFADRHTLRKHSARHVGAGDVGKPSMITNSATAKLTAGGGGAAVVSGSADLAAGKTSTSDVPEGVDPAIRKGLMDHAFPYYMPSASVDRLAYLGGGGGGGMVDGYVGLRAAVERFDGLGSCGKIFQEL